jgi:hypothetical protein
VFKGLSLLQYHVGRFGCWPQSITTKRHSFRLGGSPCRQLISRLIQSIISNGFKLDGISFG